MTPLRRAKAWTGFLLAGAAALLAPGEQASAQSGPVFWDRRGATGGCCRDSNGHDGAPGTDDFVLQQSGLDIRASGDAVRIDVSGGNGGDGSDVDSRNHWGGNGGIGRIIVYTLAKSSLYSTGGAGLVGISKGGDGGHWGNGSDWGNGADGHAVSLTLSGTTLFASGYGVSAMSLGGAGQYSAIPNGFGAERDAGTGGGAGDVRVTLGSAAISVQAAAVGGFPNELGAGVRALSMGGDGGAALHVGDFGGHSTGGRGGSGGNVTVTAEGDSSITTSGDRSAGILARSVGGSARTWDGGAPPDTRAADGGNAGLVSVTSGALIATAGARSPGILAASLGGHGSDGGGGTWGSGHPGGAGGTPDGVAIVHYGEISTRGPDSPGIVAMVVGGSGGAGGASGASGHGGNGGAGGGTGAKAVSIEHRGTISTLGQSSTGILAHAVGGGGGASGDSHGAFFVGGGNGGNAGTGGVLGLVSSGAITTSGDHSDAVLLQSIGGGGGSGGDADSTGVIVAMAVGGRGGTAGDGGNITAEVSGRFSTAGAGSTGLTLQSVGGGGGRGGSAKAASVGVLVGIGMSVGGNGGAGGSAGGLAVTFDPSASINTQGALSHALVAQAIGGGGGSGAFADSAQATIAPQLGPDLPTGTASIDHTVGGAGGAGGNGGTIFIDSSAGLTTAGARAFGMLTQSVGGGGGNGGTAAAPLRPTSVGPSDINISYGVTVGGSGGAAGNGASVSLTQQATGSVATTGDQAIGILAQSIGGGGGNGGLVQQESAFSLSPALGSPTAFLGAVTKVSEWLEKAPTGLKLGSFTNAVDARVGGNGGGAGNGGDITIANLGAVRTGGTSAPGIVAQSIAGGGGQGGAIDSTGVSSLLSSIDGMLAAAAGGVANVTALSPDIGLNVTVGSSGGDGGNGGSVSVRNSGTVATSGLASPGIVAQSIAGGGGNASVADQSLADVVRERGGDQAPAILDRITSILSFMGSKGLSMTRGLAIGVGGSNGGDGNGGTVSVDLSATTSKVSTNGAFSPAVLAQSIGGGGGTADVASDRFGASGFAALPHGGANALSMTLGATRTFSGSAFGAQPHMDGGSVVVNSGGTIATQGAASVGILAQSVSGGGGVAVLALDSSAATSLATGRQAQSPGISLGGNLNRNGGTTRAPSIRGGDVTVSTQGSLSTTGTLAHGVIAQSVGGGGGVAVLSATPRIDGLLAASEVGLGAIGGQFGVAADGGNVTAHLNGSVTTQGSLAFGVLAQSVGNGGGYVALTRGDLAATAPMKLRLGGSGNSSGLGGNTTVSVDGQVRTSGLGAHGVVAQSVGGGGGIAGLTTAAGTLTLRGVSSTGLDDFQFSHGGTVHVTARGRVETSGQGAIGILAQSVGGGGGIAGDTASVSYTPGLVQRAGWAGGQGGGGLVTVEVGCAPGAGCPGAGSVATTGANAPAVLAMSLGGGAVFKDGGIFLSNPNGFSDSSPIDAGGAVTVNVHRGATAAAMGAASPAIVAVSAGSTNAGNGTQGSRIAINVAQGAGVSANAASGTGILGITTDAVAIINAGSIAAGTAIVTPGQGLIDNSGRIAGHVDIGGNSSQASNFDNRAGASFESGSQLAVHGGALNNAGVISPGGPGVFTTTRMSAGRFNQTGTGSFAADLDFANGRSDQLSSSAVSYFGGSVVPLTQNPVRGTVLTLIHSDPVLPVDSVELSVADASPVFSYPLRISADRHDVQIAVDANFKPAGVALNKDQGAVATHLQSLWDTGSVAAAPLFGTLTPLSGAGAYVQALGSIASDVALSRASRRGQENYAFLNRLMSCPSFVGGGMRLAEGECTWGRVVGGSADRSTTHEDSGYRSSQVAYQVGTQKRVAPDWFLGASMSYADTDTRSDDRTVSATSNGVQGGITLKHQAGDWLFAGALLGGYENSQQNRRIVLPGFFATANARPDAWFFGGRARIARQLEFDTWYLKPFVDLDVTREHGSAYRETGAGPFDLAYGSTARTTWMATPSIEIGGRIDLDAATLRPYLAFGVSSVMGGDHRASLSLAAFSMQPFQITTEMPKTYGDLTAGVELLNRSGWEFRAEYRVRVASGYVDQSGMLRLARHF
ncbi:autotransporter outer membrane beta-barrel domain-containing protein [Variovorax sp. J31P179]|uniref:autotransporter outer membrane beta-barrel domain-containing protein n=1 Tax=Variovorax sp. J31P179 TaxID=3053508 RepID=UPI002577C551|nr:autotransporter outer membrane beta-barrel domain-containing protein [Variovorax sp. J31P179]MDM0085070.1 autotransporter outer membrane beta-barrel domain-containing protein [Variovorax sp. J31P179]